MTHHPQHPPIGDPAAPSPRTPRHVRRLVGVVGILLGPPLAVAVFAMASLAAALLIDTPAVLISMGVLASLAFTYLGARLTLWMCGVARHRTAAIAISGVGTALLLTAFWATFLRPLIPEDEQFAIALPQDVEVWRLASGSHVAVKKVDGRGDQRVPPIVFLHGGPGGYSISLQATVEAIGQLSEDGHDVYLYDQVGGGLSARLEDARDYTIERHLMDLNAVFKRIGTAKMILIGSSWGASLGASYMARHPEHVAAAVFSGPGPMYHPSWAPGEEGGLEERLTTDQAEQFTHMVKTPRLLAALALAEISPKAATRFASEWELGSLFDRVANAFYLPLAVCDLRGTEISSSGYGFWSNRMTGRSLGLPRQDPRPALRSNPTPVLILRGECDYKHEAVAQEYASVLPNAQFERFDDAGHMLYWERPQAYLQRVRRFLRRTAGDP